MKFWSDGAAISIAMASQQTIQLEPKRDVHDVHVYLPVLFWWLDQVAHLCWHSATLNPCCPFWNSEIPVSLSVSYVSLSFVTGRRTTHQAFAAQLSDSSQAWTWEQKPSGMLLFLFQVVFCFIKFQIIILQIFRNAFSMERTSFKSFRSKELKPPVLF